MRTKAPHVVALLALSGVSAALMLSCTSRNSEPAPAPTAPSAEQTPAETPPDLDGPPPPEGFEEELATEREGALIDDARERAIEAAKAEERERLENLKREQAAAAPNGDAFRSLTQTELTEQRERQFQSETVDRNWAPGAQAEILEKIPQTGLAATNVRVECRTTVCRLEVIERASESPASIPVAVALLQLGEWQPSFPKQVDAAGGARTTVSYLARK
jgi:hypothetical protein